MTVQVIGDDMPVTTPRRVRRAIERQACSGLLLKPNQVGTVTETIEACRLAESAHWVVMASHRCTVTPPRLPGT